MFWTRMHGGCTHFPIALLCAALLFDSLAFFCKNEARRDRLRAAGFYSLILAGAGALASGLSGLAICKWEFCGQGILATHHLFAWPACGLLLGMGWWRVAAGDKASRRGLAVYLIIALGATVLMLVAGYWGGELLIGN